LFIFEGEAYIKNYHDPDFARISLAHQVVVLYISLTLNTLKLLLLLSKILWRNRIFY